MDVAGIVTNLQSNGGREVFSYRSATTLRVYQAMSEDKNSQKHRGSAR